MLALLVATLVGVLPLAGIVAKGLGAIAIIFGVGVLLGVFLTVTVTSRVKNIRKR